MLPEFMKRQYGERKVTDDAVSQVPLSTSGKASGAPTTQPTQAPQEAEALSNDYARDIRATNPLATLPRDIQDRMAQAKAIYEMAAHPGAGEFEVDLANILMDELAPKEQPKQEQPKQEKPKQEDK